MNIYNWKKNTILFLASQNISLFGSMLVQYAITWHITIVTQSGFMMTLSIVFGFLPTFFISPFAGVWADRFNRKLLIVISDFFIAAATLGLAVFFLLGYDAIWLLLVASAIRSVGAGIQTPAVSAILPQIVPFEHLTRVNSINGSVQALVSLASPMISGALLTMATIESIFFIDVVTAAFAIFILLVLLNVPDYQKKNIEKDASYLKDMLEGLRYIREHSFVKTIFAYSAVFFVLFAPLAFLTPLQVTRTFGNDVWRLTVIEVTFSVGMMLGGLILAAWGGFKNKIHTILASSFSVAVFTIALGIVPVFWIYSAIMAFIGLVVPLFNTPFTVMLQEKVEADYLGRVFGVLTMISNSVMPLAMLIYGPLADYIRIEWMLIVTGLLMFIESLIMMKSKVLLLAGKSNM